MRYSKPILGSLLLAAAGLLWAAAAKPSMWRDIKAADIPLSGPRLITPVAARTFQLDYNALRTTLLKAPMQATAGVSGVLVDLPMPDGSTVAFRMVQTAVMAPALAAKFPDIKTFAGTAVGDALTQGRFDIGPRGLHGMVFTPRGVIYIDPFSRGDTAHYQVYYKKDSRRDGGLPADKVVIPPKRKPAAKKSSATGALLGNKGVTIGGELRTYRLALAANGEYSEFQDPPTSPIDLPDKAIVLAELVNVVNRVTGIYEREVGIRLQLVADNDAIIFQNGAADPYVDEEGTQMLAVNTGVIDGLIGTANYDIGHVTSTGGGGVAFLGVICDQLMKGGGVTGLPTPIGDGYYVDYVAHEMGHQFGGNHTFNSESGSCGGGNRNAGTAYEPGSGVSIMAYAGICDEDDIANNSEDYFHAASYDEIVAHSREGSGGECAVITTNTNRPPLANAGVGGFTIPKNTPFELTGSGSDPDGDPITYQWEQFDLGAGGLAEAPDASAPLFRNFQPSNSPTRSFPQASVLANGVSVIGERLPEVARTLNFRFTVRDNRTAAMGTLEKPEAGGVTSSDLQFFVANVGPFLLTAPNGSETFTTGVPLTVTWDAAGTAAAPVSCATVDILLSINSGMSYPFTLATAQANDGSQSVTLPAGSATDTARIKVKCASNVFFDLSNADFKILAGAVVPPTPPTPSVPLNTLAAAPSPTAAPVIAPGRFGGSLPLAASGLLWAAALLRRRRRSRQ